TASTGQAGSVVRVYAFRRENNEEKGEEGSKKRRGPGRSVPGSPPARPKYVRRSATAFPIGRGVESVEIARCRAASARPAGDAALRCETPRVTQGAPSAGSTPGFWNALAPRPR